ncbi:60S ribosomal protein L18a-like protein [Coffea eugenioides]|uniref:60S ribosomal protein L18a-like protein n=1 Tax=Coffea eugenioides TaxID=49369 RepID=UPI000F605E7A|nr:60S ribosomal protein L18a-like protein [Coffea eugenioides]XP_027175217.1 60S ribosomal protein L18a-like protein [Coffea eugenioides]
MDQNITIEEGDVKGGLELVKSVSDKHLDLLRPSARYYSIFKGQVADATDREKGKYTLIRDADDFQPSIYDKPLPCFGCGVGWFSFLLGFVCPIMWYYATLLYFGNYYKKDPRERAGLAASAIAAMAFSVFLLIILVVVLLF